MLLSDAFANGESLRRYCLENDIPIYEAMTVRREESSATNRARKSSPRCRKTLTSCAHPWNGGLSGKVESVSGLSGGEAMKLFKYGKHNPFSGYTACPRGCSTSMAVVEVNASMGRIVAAPTAGASGILAGALIEAGRQRGWSGRRSWKGYSPRARSG